jgi:hypothetical protein
LKQRHERLLVGTFLFCICFQLAQAVHTAWFSYAARLSPGPSVDVSILFGQESKPLAPQAYRLALPTLIRFVAETFHVHDRSQVAAAFDLVAGFFALYLLYLLTVNSLPENAKTTNRRTLSVLLFLAIIQFPLACVVPWQRPETLPSSLYLSTALFSLANINRSRWWALVLLVTTLFQSFVRADVAFVLGIAVVLVGIWSRIEGAFQTSRVQLTVGGLIVTVSGAIQGYLQLVRLPHLHYPSNTKVVQLTMNLMPHRVEVFSIAMLPFFLFFLPMIVKRPALNDLERVAVVASALYLPLWLTVGSIAEVRIYVPFLLALSMVAARVSASFLNDRPAIAS